MGATGTTGPAQFTIFPFSAASLMVGRVNDVGVGAGTPGGSSGWFVANRTGASAVAAYRNNVSVFSASTAAVALPDRSIFIGGANAGSLASASSDGIAAASIGAGLTAGDMTALYNAVHTYLQAVAGVA
jgi:hypothetical protein